MKNVILRQPRSQFSTLNAQFKRLIRRSFLSFLGFLAGPFVRSPPDSVSSLLYIKPDHLGDLLLATPVLAALRQRFPAARITALVGPWSKLALQRNPDIDLLLTCPFPGFERGTKDEGRRDEGRRTKDEGRRTKDEESALSRLFWSLVFRLSSLAKPYLILLEYALLLRACRYDLAIVGRDDHWWGAALALLAGVPWRVGFAVPECRPFLSIALPWNPRAHVTAQGLALVEAAGHEQASSLKPPFSARFDLSQDDITWVESWMRSCGLGGHERLVVIHPGTGGPAKLWLPERWAQVADALAENGARLLLTGGPDERALAVEIAARMQAPVLTLAGQTSVGQLAALFRRATLVLGVDSGPLHLAAAQDVLTLHLYGPGDAGRFGPWGDPARHVVLREDLWCSPCGEFSACPRGLVRPECMERIAVARVIAQARRMIG